jgi:hypothetical protein
MAVHFCETLRNYQTRRRHIPNVSDVCTRRYDTSRSVCTIKVVNDADQISSHFRGGVTLGKSLVGMLSKGVIAEVNVTSRHVPDGQRF